MKKNLVELSVYTWGRTRQRLEGLTDEEYLWEPVPGCWSVRQGDDGSYRAEGSDDVEPAPVTTIAWRLAHVTTCYGQRRNREWLGVALDGSGHFEAGTPVAASAHEALAALEDAHGEWSVVLDSVTEASLHDALGPVAGPYAEADRCDFVLHMIDEFIHHGAELALMRDLWRVGHNG